MNSEQATRSMQAMGRAMRPDAYRTLSGAKAAYVRGDIEVGELEQRVQDVLDGTAECRHREQLGRYCDEHGHAWMRLAQDALPSRCAHCGEPYSA